MRFKLPRQVLNKEISRIASREVEKQEIVLIRASKEKLRQMAEISEIIKKSGLPNYLVCKKLPKDLGHGIFLHPKAKPILKGQVIAPYSGEINFEPEFDSEESLYAFCPLAAIHFTKEDQAIFDPKRKHQPRRLYALNVDALKTGNFTRFINHSSKPNVIAELFKIPPNTFGLTPAPIEVVYIAKKTILPGEQLLVCYDDEDGSYWGPLKIKPVPITPQTFQLNASLKIIETSK